MGEFKPMTFLPEIFAPERLFFFWKGRVALYTILKAMGVGEGDEVILPGFTCVVVANAVLYLGARPVYADIDPLTYNITPETVASLITPKTKVIIAQNTFGLSPDLDALMSLAERHGLYVIEDCAHGLGGSYKGRPAGTNTHASFFSTQWSKPVTTALGGIAYTSDDDLLPKVAAIAKALPRPGLLAESILAGQRLVRPLADNPHLYYALVDAYRFLTQKLGLSIGSSVGDELNSVTMPENYLLGMGKLQHKALQKTGRTLKAAVRRRQKIAQKYDAFFRERGISVPYRPDYAEHTMLRYTFRVPDKAAILQKAQRLHIPLGDWFVSPLHPVEGDLSRWGYRAGQCPESERACRECVNLLPEQDVSLGQLKQLLSAD